MRQRMAGCVPRSDGKHLLRPVTNQARIPHHLFH